jgi:hypothetical protein
MKKSYQISMIAVIIVILSVIYWNSPISTNKKFIDLLEIVGALGILLAVYNIYRNSESDKKDIANEKTRMFAEAMNNLINAQNSLILSSNDNSGALKRYYLELIGQAPENYENVDTASEILLTVNILGALAQVLEYNKTHEGIAPDSELVLLLTERAHKIMSQYVKSKKFVSYWKIYKNTYSCDLIVDYMASNFGL